MKKTLSLLLTLALLLGLASFGTALAENDMTAGIYWIGGNDGTSIPFTWIKLYEDGTYYEKDFEGSFTSAGTYELIDEGTEYLEDSDGDKWALEGDPIKTSEQSVIFTDYKTGTIRRVAYVDDAFVDMSVGNGMSRNRKLLHNAEYPFNEATDVIPIQIYVFYANQDPGANFILNHNRTFEDVTGDYFEEGIWTMTAPGEYDLTYTDDTKATLITADGGKHGILTRGEAVTELSYDYNEVILSGDAAIVTATFSAADQAVGLPINADLTIECHKDGSCALYVYIAPLDANLLADQGTYEVDPAINYTFHFEEAGDVTGTPDYSTATENSVEISIFYYGEMTVTSPTGGEADLLIASTLTGTHHAE